MAARILVVYYSKSGNTERVALDLARELEADWEKLVDKKNRRGILGYIFGGRDGMNKQTTELEAVGKDAGGYDLVVVGTPVWGWNMTPAVRTYLELNKTRIKKLVFFCTSGNTDSNKLVDNVREIVGDRLILDWGFNGQEMVKKDSYQLKLSELIKKINEIM